MWIHFIAFIFLPFCLSGCKGCDNSDKRKISGSVAASTDEDGDGDEDTDDPTVRSTDSPDPDTVVDNQIHEVEEDVEVLETEDETLDTTLLFSSPNDDKLLGRYLHENILIVRSSGSSCIRLQFEAHPTQEGTLGSDQFEETKSKMCSDAAQTTEEDPTPTEDGAADPRVNEEAEVVEDPRINNGEEEVANLRLLNFGQINKESEFNLVNEELCSRKVFKMPSKDIEDKESTVSKTAWLVALSSDKTVGLWLDDEYDYLCASGQPNDSARRVFERTDGTYYDRLSLAHLQNIADQVSTMATSLTTHFGAMSDIDKNGRVNVFLSPEVNRTYLSSSDQQDIDSFQATFVHKPYDLAEYHAAVNPNSNQGETLYLWVPDPLGVYRYYSYPSSNSLTSKYAKGFLASQIMALIITNAKMIEGTAKVPEETWLIESLGLLASTYIAGNSWTFLPTALYLTSRTHKISLTEDLGEDAALDRWSQLGMRSLFGWYLHAKLCPDNGVTICTPLKQIVVDPEVGTANIEKLFGTSFAKVLENFGLSIGLTLSDNQWDILNGWKEDFPPRAVVLPPLTEVLPSLTTIRNNATADNELVPETDRAFGGPFTSLDSMLFRPLLPDSGIELEMAKHAIAYIKVQGMVAKQSEVFATIGPKLNAVMIPAGNRNPNKSMLHTEKVSENAPMDQRPINLTSDVDPLAMNYAPSYYGETSDQFLTLSHEREIVILGSIDNFKVIQENNKVIVGDSDSFVINVNPCQNLEGDALSAC